MTKLDQEMAKKRKHQEAEDIIAQIGKKGKKGVSATKTYFREKEKEGKKKREKVLNRLDLKKSFVTYNSLLAELLIAKLKEIDWPPFWKCNVAPTKEGIVMEIKSADGRYFRAAFKPVRDPLYDLNAVETYIVRAENTIDRATGADGQKKEKN